MVRVSFFLLILMNDHQPIPKEPASFAPPKAMTRIATIVQRISTAWAAQIAWKWFLTPYPFNIPKRELPFEQRFGNPTLFTHDNGKKYPVYSLGKGSKNILLVHGWAGRFTQFSAIICHLEKEYPSLLEEYTITGFNAVAHRGAQGKRTMMPEIAACIRDVTETLNAVDVVIAHSLGSNATMYAVQNLGAKIKRQVLIAPPGRISAMVAIFCNVIGFNNKVRVQIIQNLEAKFGDDFDTFSAPELAPSNKIPTLVFHDANDNDTPIELGREVGLMMQNGEYIETVGLGHRRILRDKEVLKTIAHWIFNIS